MIVGCGMFGYVRVYQPELKMGEFEQYRGVYCSLCKSLGKRYGFFARMTLSYDFTFLAVFHMALQKGCAGFRMGRCALNPLKKRMCCRENEEIAYAADAAVLLLYHKLRDTVAAVCSRAWGPDSCCFSSPGRRKRPLRFSRSWTAW